MFPLNIECLSDRLFNPHKVERPLKVCIMLIACCRTVNNKIVTFDKFQNKDVNCIL